MHDKILFLNTGWMDFYKGLSDNDTITGGGKHVDSMGWGGEIYNFQPFENRMYGYVQPFIDRKHDNPSTIKLEKIGSTVDDQYLHGVTVIWTASDPNNGGTYIIGWYKNATVYRYYQRPPANSKRKYKKEILGYYVTAKRKDALLLPNDERIVRIKRKTRNWMGQSNVWYADNNPEFVAKAKAYVFEGIIPVEPKTEKGRKGSTRQSDPLKRLEVEKKAILYVTKYFERLGYVVQSFEKDNVGWDLTATNDKTQLKLEVKGLSGTVLATELTPNEFMHLKKDTKFYRLCIASNILTKPDLKIFFFSKDINAWTTDEGIILKFQEVISVKISV